MIHVSTYTIDRFDPHRLFHAWIPLISRCFLRRLFFRKFPNAFIIVILRVNFRLHSLSFFAILELFKKLTPKIRSIAQRTILSWDETFVAKLPERIARTSDSLQVRRLEKKRWVIVLLSWKKNPIVDLNENRQNLFYFYQLIIKIIIYSTIRRRIILCDNSTQTVTSSTLKGKWQEPARSESCICAKEERCVQDQNDFASRSNAILLNLSLSV